MHDLIIIGGGMAGLTAAIYAARAGLDYIVLEQDGWGGGQIASAHRVDNFPGCPKIDGSDLAEKVREQSTDLGSQIEFANVVSIELIDEAGACCDKSLNRKTIKKVILDDGNYILSKAVIAATGAGPRKLGISGEERLLGRGVSYCATCDGSFFKGEKICVAGGGDTAIEDAIYLSGICENVTLIHRRDTFRASMTRLETLKSLSNVDILCGQTITEITGQESVSGIRIKSASEENELNTAALFIAIGREPSTAYLKNLPLDFDGDYCVAGEDCRTNIPGIFAAGDIRRKHLYQAITAAADGANAVNSVMEYLQS